MSTNQLGDLRIFAEVVRTGSFSAAARRLRLPPSSVSRCIAALERRLGVVLFTRTTRRVTPTDAGRSYGERIQHLLASLDEADRAVGSFGRRPHGLLRIESRVGLGSRFIAPLVPSFLREHPEVSIDLRLTTGTLDAPGAGIDMAVRFGLGHPSSLITRRVGSPRQRLWATSGYLAEHGTPRRPGDLARHNCLVFVPEGGAPQWRFRRGRTEEVVRPHGTFSSNDVAALAVGLAGGLGIAVCHDWFVADEFRSASPAPGLIPYLVQVLPDWDVTTMHSFDTQIYVVYAAGAQDSPNARAFTTHLARCFADG